MTDKEVNEFEGVHQNSKWCPDMLEKAQYYLESWDKEPFDDSIPMLCAMYVYCGIDKNTGSSYQKKYESWKSICDRIMTMQEHVLIDKGLKKVNETQLTKLLLMKHGHNDRVAMDLTTNGESVNSHCSKEDTAALVDQIRKELGNG